MNFFKSIFSADNSVAADPNSQHDHAQPSSPSPPPSPPNPNPNPNPNWPNLNLTTLLKSVTTKSDSIIDHYRRDLTEFSSGLISETAIIRAAATRAIQRLPDSLDSSAAAAQLSLESVGQVIDDLGSSVIKSTTKIMELSIFDDEGGGGRGDEDVIERRLSVGVKMSRFEVKLREMEGDVRTYVEEVEGEEEYREWEKGFVMEEKRDEIEGLMREEEEGIVGRMYREIVPGVVAREVFWRRYFYRVYKLREAEETRERIVKRAMMAGEDEEELSWDVDDDDDEDVDDKGRDGDREEEKMSCVMEDEKIEKDGSEVSVRDVDDLVVNDALRKMEIVGLADAKDESDVCEASRDVEVAKADDESSIAEVVEGKTENGESCKDSDISIVSTQPSLAGEEELGWDEIEDLGSDDETHKAATSKGMNVTDLRKRLSVAEEEDDLSWDIEDEDDDDKPTNLVRLYAKAGRFGMLNDRPNLGLCI
ncbi:BSD domain-containing protein [Drosera capensis]